MTTLILLGGLGVAVVLAAVAIERGWRLPALVFATLSLPGNVDNLMPQMLLDPHPIADTTAPVVSIVDLLILWALALTLAERHRSGRGSWHSPVLLGLAGLLLIVASVSAATGLLSGVDLGAVARGIILFGRLAALLALTDLLADAVGDASRIGLATAAGGIVLLANGAYTTFTQSTDRFTAATFGRNDFGVALILVALICLGSMLALRRQRREVHHTALFWAVTLVCGGLLFGATATGTRAALLALAIGLVVALLINRTWLNRSGLLVVATFGLFIALMIGSASVLTSAGARTTSVLTDPGASVGAFADPPDDTPSEIRSREDFWRLAMIMIRDHPLTGVGPYQWNWQRYELDPQSPTVVADTHDAYLQLGAEYGLPSLALYLALIAVCLLTFLKDAVRRSPIASAWTATACVSVACAFFLADVTNSNLFNGRTGTFAWLIIGAGIAAGAAIDDEAVRALGFRSWRRSGSRTQTGTNG
ncbi:MAG TPA: O-antigen ligase family protein [Candidatus Limnocylindrales bacterium]|nr:O-antigen ligase family protein [Candidatus Limnocylindrales bacterium]